ncbi:MAG: MtrB/PioB family outer membrane beta-barrel protein [Deltaproteobacteria bacterium]|nr:MtrB/PioB family outer membrane beta-barrel protein [Deltaproteobacteria bacterium]
MKANTAIIAAMLILLPLCGASAADGQFSGEISLDPTYKHAAGNEAKAFEYEDPRSGVYGNADLKYETPKDRVELEARDVGYDTQRYRLEGGRWDSYRYQLQYEELPHNFTFDTRTLYSGTESSNLTYGTHPPNANPNTWNTFDYSVKRKNMGGGLKLDLLKPFYLDVAASRQEKSGSYPIGAAGTSPGGIAIEMPAWLDYTTDTIKAEAGYVRNPLFFSLSYLYSRFDNGNGVQNFRNPATANTAATTDTFHLPPENDAYKLDFKGGVRLPFRSKFNVNLSTSRANSASRLETSYVSDVTAAASTIGVQGREGLGLSSPYFNGKVDTNNYHFALTTNPISFLDAKLFYKYFSRSNKSDQITTTDAAAGAVLANELFSYRKNSYGLEMGFKLPQHFLLTADYQYTKTERDRVDLPENRDNLFGVDLKWSGLDFMALKLGYERLDRAADFVGDPTGYEPFQRRFDAAPQERDTYKVSAEFFPMETLSFNIGYKYKRTNYKDTLLGLTDSRADEVSFDVDWRAHKQVRLFAFADFEKRSQNQRERQPTYDWTLNQDEKTYEYGLGAEIAIIPKKLTLKLEHSSIRSDGSVDYTYLGVIPAGRTQNDDLSNWDSYRLTSYIAKATYELTKAISLSAAYAFQEFLYDDDQYAGYRYVIGANPTRLTGAYLEPGYRSHVVYVSAGIHF